MKKWLLGFFTFAIAFSAHATVVEGTDTPNNDTIISFGNQPNPFNLSGTLTLDNSNANVQLNQNQASEFGLYKDGNLLKDVSFFTTYQTNGYAFTFNNLATGNYYLLFNVTSGQRDYTVTYNLTSVAVVPEPLSSAMMLFGVTGLCLAVYIKRYA